MAETLKPSNEITARKEKNQRRKNRN